MENCPLNEHTYMKTVKSTLQIHVYILLWSQTVTTIWIGVNMIASKIHDFLTFIHNMES